jgi:hypothetical protein
MQSKTLAAGSSQTLPATAVATKGTDRTHFLSGLGCFGSKSTTPLMGHSESETGVVVFNEDLTEVPVSFSLKNGGFNLHLFFSTAEARTLAQALTMAADHADRARLDADIDAAATVAGVVL